MMVRVVRVVSHSLIEDRLLLSYFAISAVLFAVWLHLQQKVTFAVTDNPYKILGVAPESSLKDMKQAYRRKAIKYHYGD